MTEEVDVLNIFLNNFLRAAPPIGFVPLMNPITRIEDTTSVVWFRDEQFQVELFIVPPNYIIPEHTHPNVDSYEVYLGGQIKFSHTGKWVNDYESEPSLEQANPGTAINRGRVIRVRPTDRHGGQFGPSGGVFMSVQHWLNGVKPHCVALDYHGLTVGPDHLSKVKYGLAYVKENEPLVPNDAATEEVVSRVQD